jgi:hemoglobin/transferrin/lactoferrin receptor protein
MPVRCNLIRLRIIRHGVGLMQAGQLSRQRATKISERNGGKRAQIKSTLLFKLMMTTALALTSISYSMPAFAQTTPTKSRDGRTAFNVPSQTLSKSLVAVSKATGAQLFFDARIVWDKSAPSLHGSLTTSEALSQLLDGTGLSYRIDGNTVTISDPRVSLSPAATDGSTVLDTITVRDGRGGVASDAPYRTAGSSAFISGEQVERFKGSSIGDFLGGVPGVLNGDGRNSGAVDVNIRGMQGQGRVPVIVDGASQETSVYQGYNGSTSGSYIDPDFIGSVAIEKGPSMGADATGATGGVVRVSTIGVDDILLPGKSFGIRVKGSFNTNSSSIPDAGTAAGTTAGGTYWYPDTPPTSFGSSDGMDRPDFLSPTGGSGSVAVAGTTEYVDVVAAYARRRNGNYHAGKNGGDAAYPLFTTLDDYGSVQVTNGGLTPYRAGEEVLNTSLDNETWLLKGTIKLDNGHSLELGYTQYSSAYGHILGSQANAVFGGTYQGELSTIDLDTYTARYKWNPDDNDLINLKVDTFLSKVDNRINASFNSGGTLYPTYSWAGIERRGVAVSNTSSFFTDIGDFNLTYGGAFTYEEAGLPDGVEVGTPNITSTRTGWRKEGSAFTASEWKPSDWLTVNAGLRYSRFETLDEGVTDVWGGKLPNFSRSAGGWSPSAGVTVEPLDGVQLYGKISSTMRSPSVFESLQGGSFALPVDENPVAPERNRSVEIGSNYLQDDVFIDGDKLRIHAAYFDNHIDDYITRSNVRRVLSNGNVSYTNLGRLNLDYAEMRGFEIGGEYDSGQYFGGISWNHYTHMMFCAPEGMINPAWTQCGSGGIFNSFSLQQVPPKDTVTVNLGGRFLDDKLTIGSRLSYVGSRFVEGIGDGSENTTNAPGVSSVRPSKWNPYTLVDLYASYKVNENATIDLSVDNLTDLYYVDALNAINVPGPGRTVRANFSVKF